MDHVMDHIRNYMQSDVYELRSEYESEQYNKLSDCPSYYVVKVYCEAHNILVRAYYHKDEVKRYLISPKSLLEDIPG